MVWLGPALEDVSLSFMSIFQRSTVLEGDCFAGLDAESKYLEMLQYLAARRGIYMEDDKLKGTAFETFLVAGGQKIFAALRREFEAGHKVGLGGSFNADLTQVCEPTLCMAG